MWLKGAAVSAKLINRLLILKVYLPGLSAERLVVRFHPES